MSTVPNPSQDRIYPLPAPADDRRCNMGLLIDVAKVLVAHGFPPITAGGDLVALQQALYGFLYAAPDSGLSYSRDLSPAEPQTPAPGITGQPLTGRSAAPRTGDDPVTGVPVCKHGDDAAACQLRHDAVPTTREPIAAACVGAPAGFEAEQCPPECRQNWQAASDPLTHVAHCSAHVADPDECDGDCGDPACSAVPAETGPVTR